MAAIDKIYVNNWQDFCEVRDYFKNTVYDCANGTKCYLINYLYEYDENDITPDFFDGKRDVPITNTPCNVDYLLHKYCPIKVVQEYLQRCYSNQYWDEFEKWDRNPGTKVKMIQCPKYGKINKPFKFHQSALWFVHVETPVYNEEYEEFISEHPTYYSNVNEWVYDKDLIFYEIENSWHGCKFKTIKSVIRNIKKWKLPKGSIVTVYGRYIGEIYEFIVK